ncbi:UPF0348 protein family [Halalkalibacter wakoensis JCM 9140]|uniref:tRNA(Met) cytidine acetate ligase n=1 Tax=Halalkalibacter wakoensis JCM 9140 TaxID=1236970 RepID=W4PWL2_9BACI|nr:nucleotidyltransferase [Halalkalibacter wakoensis]GAE24132.1 UPF0348 protein family [Halalkalibacter wakoensis JCM 9140]
MKAVGIVVEYNPFHNGHLFQVNQAKKITGAEVVVAIMSGTFLQRGEPAIISKWYRTKMALLSGVDLVIELPYCYSAQKAELFANGAISLLSEIGVDFLNFGSESGDIQEFLQFVTFMNKHQTEFDQFVQANMKLGYSYPRAASAAFTQLHTSSTALSLTEPNNILGFHYVKAIADQKCTIKPTTTLRKAAQYHDEDIREGTIASATSIRKLLTSNQLEESKHVMPEPSYQLLKNYQETYSLFHTWEEYYPLLQYKLLSTPVNELRSIYECEEGLEYRLKEASKKADSFHDWMNLVKTKRYTWTRLQRVSTHIVTNTTKIEMNEALNTKPNYLRLLGMTEKGQAYLNKTRKRRTLPIRKPAKVEGIMTELEERAANVYLSILPSHTRTAEMKKEATRSPIRL